MRYPPTHTSNTNTTQVTRTHVHTKKKNKEKIVTAVAINGNFWGIASTSRQSTPASLPQASYHYRHRIQGQDGRGRQQATEAADLGHSWAGMRVSQHQHTAQSTRVAHLLPCVLMTPQTAAVAMCIFGNIAYLVLPLFTLSDLMVCFIVLFLIQGFIINVFGHSRNDILLLLFDYRYMCLCMAHYCVW